MTSKQIKELKKGEYRNSDLNRIDPSHCKPKGAKPEGHFYYRKPTKKLVGGVVYALKNRKQRRQGIEA